MNGIKQGQILFSLVYNALIDNCNSECPAVSLNGKQTISVLCYADDVVILSRSLEGLLKLFGCVRRWASFDIQFNDEKSKLMMRGTKSKRFSMHIKADVEETLKFENINIPYCLNGDFKYLGYNMNKDIEINNRVRALYAAAHKCSRNSNFNIKKCSRSVKKIIFNAYVKSTLYCISHQQKIDQKIRTAYRYCILAFYGNDRSINILDVNSAVTRTRTLLNLTGLQSIDEIYRFEAFGLYQRMRNAGNMLTNSYCNYALSEIVFANNLRTKHFTLV